MNAEESDKTPCMCASNFRGFPNNHFPVFPTRCNEAPVVRDLDTGYSSIMCKNLGEHLSTKQIPDQKTSRTATRENRGTIPAETSEWRLSILAKQDRSGTDIQYFEGLILAA